MTASLTPDRRRPLPSSPTVAVQPVRLSVTRYASLDENSAIASFSSLSTSDQPHPGASPSPSPTPAGMPGPRDSPVPDVPTRAPEREMPSQPSFLPSLDHSSLDPFDNSSTSNKSARTTAVIGRLTSSLESAKRDLTAERLQHEETLRSLAAAKQRIETLQADNNNLVYSRESGTRMLERRDQRIAELRAQLETECRRREIAEAASRDMGARLDEVLQTSKQDVAEAKDARGRAEAQYAALRGAFNAHKSDLERIKKALKEHRTVREEDVNKIVMLEAVCDRQAAEAKRADALVKAMSKTLEGYQEQARLLQRTQAEMEEVRDQMRWVVQLHQNRDDTTTSPG